jgi:hypothetical protein
MRYCSHSFYYCSQGNFGGLVGFLREELEGAFFMDVHIEREDAGYCPRMFPSPLLPVFTACV